MGQNPFDKYVEKKESIPLSQSPQAPGALWERMRKAQATALAQRELTREALDESRVEEPLNSPTPTIPTPSASSSVSDYKIWFGFVFLLWLVPSLGAFSQSFLGGVVVALVWAFVCLTIARIPGMAAGAFSGGGRNSRGAAV